MCVDFEIDFPEAMLRKWQCIQKHKELLDIIQQHNTQHPSSPSSSSSSLPFSLPGAHDYYMIGADMRDITGMDASLRAAGLNPELPTLVLAECVLVYLKPQESAVSLYIYIVT